jgi:hypothetical protein
MRKRRVLAPAVAPPARRRKAIQRAVDAVVKARQLDEMRCLRCGAGPYDTIALIDRMCAECAALGMEAPSGGETACGLDPKDDSPTAESRDAQTTPPNAIRHG